MSAVVKLGTRIQKAASGKQLVQLNYENEAPWNVGNELPLVCWNPLQSIKVTYSRISFGREAKKKWKVIATIRVRIIRSK